MVADSCPRGHRAVIGGGAAICGCVVRMGCMVRPNVVCLATASGRPGECDFALPVLPPACELQTGTIAPVVADPRVVRL